MFAHMVFELRNGKLPENNLLRKRFNAALVKKMGIIRTPYSLWPADPKINPPAKQLLWAAILLQDKENYSVVEAIISAEIEEKQRAKGQPENMHALGNTVRQLLQIYIDEFIELGPTEMFKENLRQTAAELFDDHQGSTSQ